jgi:hypothetical protein
MVGGYVVTRKANSMHDSGSTDWNRVIETSGFNKEQVIGLAGILYGGRFKYFIT